MLAAQPGAEEGRAAGRGGRMIMQGRAPVSAPQPQQHRYRSCSGVRVHHQLPSWHNTSTAPGQLFPSIVICHLKR